jgi:hypothetical protein
MAQPGLDGIVRCVQDIWWIHAPSSHSEQIETIGRGASSNAGSILVDPGFKARLIPGFGALVEDEQPAMRPCFQLHDNNVDLSPENTLTAAGTMARRPARPGRRPTTSWPPSSPRLYWPDGKRLKSSVIARLLQCSIAAIKLLQRDQRRDRQAPSAECTSTRRADCRRVQS